MIRRAILGFCMAALAAGCASSPMPTPIATPRPTASNVPRTTPPRTTPPGAVTPPVVTPPPPDFALQPARFTDIPGWANSDFAPALLAFKRQCAGWKNRTPDAPLSGGRYGGNVGQWFPACDIAQNVQPGQEHWFFENYFDVSMVTGTGEQRLTSYFEPVVQASRQWTPQMTEPLLSRPSDMISIDLGAFAQAFDSDALRGAPRQLNGKLNGNTVVPYPKRDSITPYQGQIIGYAHPADVYNLQVQGSGRLAFTDGTQARAQFSAQNGYKWNSALGALRNSGRLSNPTWANFRQWLDTNPSEQKNALNADPSYVFFQEEAIADPSAGPKGGAGVPLTPMGSIAVDPAFHPYGAIVFVDGTYDSQYSFQRLLVAQDTGGAIRRGPMRGDIFAGTGPEAGAWSERMNGPARWYTLLPKAFAPTAVSSTPIASMPATAASPAG
ncbi:MAG TPA: MltA domain-containing protein [Hyphomonadaceae bacterium]|jgi:membrane-bound lytic murein transglycosylase A|nr:MltA domain-containing protein [Hyphomonadaceae bacterium]